MLKMNSEMALICSRLSLANTELASDLVDISSSGFSTKDDCIFLTKCLEIDTNAELNDFPDRTGFECFINSVNIDDYVEDGYLEQGLCFVRKVFFQWNKNNGNQKLISILLMDEIGLKIKIHLHRPGESWLTEELEDYEESIMLIDSSESDFLGGCNGAASVI